MWSREDARPVTWKGIQFRSMIEAKVAKELDGLGVRWEYEAPVQGVNWYLPDFTIIDAPEELQLPRWVEVKPGDLIYNLRDYVGCPERAPEGDHDGYTHTSAITAKQVHDIPIEEIWKPKRLAEWTGEPLLVVSAINRDRTIGAVMHPDHVELGWSHPAVNWRRIVKQREAEARWEAQRREWEKLQAQREAEAAELRAELVRLARLRGRSSRYDGWCKICQTENPAQNLMAFRYEDRWITVCRSHVVDTQSIKRRVG